LGGRGVFPVIRWSSYLPLPRPILRDGAQESLSIEMRSATVGDSRIMKVKSVILGVLCAAAVVGVAVWLGVGYQARVGLEEENQGLRQQVEQMGELAAENERLSNIVAQASQSQPLSEDQMRELLRLRGEVAALRQQGKAPGPLPNENRQAPPSAESAAPATNYWPRASWAFAGYATPNAALQSSLWAASKGDIKTLLGSFTGDAQKIAETLLSTNSESEVAAAVIGQLVGFKSLRVINSEVRDEDTVVITTQTDEEGGPQIKKAMMKKVGGEWKLYGYVP
jgi:hypothetical protein